MKKKSNIKAINQKILSTLVFLKPLIIRLNQRKEPITPTFANNVGMNPLTSVVPNPTPRRGCDLNKSIADLKEVILTPSEVPMLSPVNKEVTLIK